MERQRLAAVGGAAGVDTAWLPASLTVAMPPLVMHEEPEAPWDAGTGCAACQS